MMTLGMIPAMGLNGVVMSGNSAGAVMALCDDSNRMGSRELVGHATVVELAGNSEFQRTFVERLNFPTRD